MITRVQIRNFRSIATADVHLGPLTVLVGRNGAGKSAFLDAIHFVRDALQLGLDEALVSRNGIAGLRHWSPDEELEVEVSLTLESPQFWGHYVLAIGSDSQGAYHIAREECGVAEAPPEPQEEIEGFERVDGEWRQPIEGRDRDLAPNTLALSVPNSSKLAWLRALLIGMKFYDLQPEELKALHGPSVKFPLMEGGQNLGSALQDLTQVANWFPDIVEAMRLVAGDISDIRVEEIGGFLVPQIKHGNQNGSSPWFNLVQESDGTMQMLGLLVALYQATPGTLLAFEDAESALHPGALGVLSDVLKEASKRSQVLVTTQSPDLISRFAADELRIVERENGITKIGPLDETQREAINQQLFSAGDLLRIEGLHRAESSAEESSDNA